MKWVQDQVGVDFYMRELEVTIVAVEARMDAAKPEGEEIL
jgi:hypothetical protein